MTSDGYEYVAANDEIAQQLVNMKASGVQHLSVEAVVDDSRKWIIIHSINGLADRCGHTRIRKSFRWGKMRRGKRCLNCGDWLNEGNIKGSLSLTETREGGLSYE
jgi:hypothetical protein